MSHDRFADLDLDRATREWMLDGPATMRDTAIDEAVARALRTAQRGAQRAPRRYLTMTTRTLSRTRFGLSQLAVAAAIILAVLIGGFALLRPDLWVGDPPPVTNFDATDAERVADAPATLTDRLVVGNVPPDHRNVVEGSAFEAVHLVLASSSITRSGQADDEARREALTTRFYTGLQSAKTRFYDAIGPSGEALPVIEPGGSSFMVIVASYVDPAAASAAFPAYVESYETWGFNGTEPWDHGEESAAFTATQMDRPHGRCFVLSSTEGCLQAMRAWRIGNMVISVLAEGEGDVTADDVVAAIDAAAR